MLWKYRLQNGGHFVAIQFVGIQKQMKYGWSHYDRLLSS